MELNRNFVGQTILLVNLNRQVDINQQKTEKDSNYEIRHITFRRDLT